jgi:hypothetical protein
MKMQPRTTTSKMIRTTQPMPAARTPIATALRDWVNVYHGGETPVPKEDIHLYLDNMVIARQSIGPMKGQASKPD